MESSGSHRSVLLTGGGILSIVVGAFEMTFGGVVTALTMNGVIPGVFQLPWWPGQIHIMPSFTYLGVPLLVLGIIAIVGGVSAIKRKRFGLSLAGAICALPSGLMGILNIICVPMGILAIIFVALKKGEFGAERKGNGI